MPRMFDSVPSFTSSLDAQLAVLTRRRRLELASVAPEPASGPASNASAAPQWQEAPGAVADAEAVERAAPGVADHRARLMIADDDVVVRTMLSMALREHFVVVGHAADGEQAVELARMTRPDVALIDVEMPKGGGLHAVHEISRQSPDTAMVVLSIDEEDSVVRAFLAAGAMAYRRKGESVDLIAKSLRMAMVTRAHEHERAGTALSA